MPLSNHFQHFVAKTIKRLCSEAWSARPLSRPQKVLKKEKKLFSLRASDLWQRERSLGEPRSYFNAKDRWLARPIPSSSFLSLLANECVNRRTIIKAWWKLFWRKNSICFLARAEKNFSLFQGVFDSCLCDWWRIFLLRKWSSDRFENTSWWVPLSVIYGIFDVFSCVLKKEKKALRVFGGKSRTQTEFLNKRHISLRDTRHNNISSRQKNLYVSNNVLKKGHYEEMCQSS